MTTVQYDNRGDSQVTIEIGPVEEDEPKSNSEFHQFRDLASKLLAVPKDEIESRD